MTFRQRTVLAFVSAAAAFLPASALAQAQFTGAGEESELDCAGGSVSITGADNTLHITGVCTSVSIEGAGNRISVELAEKSVIHVTGAGNEIRWTAPGQSKPRVNVVGAGNRISRLR